MDIHGLHGIIEILKKLKKHTIQCFLFTNIIYNLKNCVFVKISKN